MEVYEKYARCKYEYMWQYANIKPFSETPTWSKCDLLFFFGGVCIAQVCCGRGSILGPIEIVELSDTRNINQILVNIALENDAWKM